jgi:acylphosphatase
MTVEKGQGGANRRRAHLTVFGKVQGVGFRSALAREAAVHGLGGWVRNLPEGSVEAVVEGPPAAVEALVKWCHRGPVRARVDGVSVAELPAVGERDFRILPTDGPPR